jgi:hypothetical protein
MGPESALKVKDKQQFVHWGSLSLNQLLGSVQHVVRIELKEPFHWWLSWLKVLLIASQM